MSVGLRVNRTALSTIAVGLVVDLSRCSSDPYFCRYAGILFLDHDIEKISIRLIKLC